MDATFHINPLTTSVVWFDLDDTVYDFHANSRRALERLYHTQGLSRFFSSADRWIDTYEHFNTLLWKDYSAALIDQPTLRMDRFRLPLTQMGVDDCTARKMSSAFDPVYLDYLAQETLLIPGAIELIDRVRRAGLLTGILSNGFTEVQHRKIQNSGLAHLFNIIVLSDDIGINKPDVRLFNHAMKLSGIDIPSRHLMIGDNPSTDIAGASAAGWQALLFLRNPGKTAPDNMPAVSSLSLISV
jgi:putative hydrolase of the HAD superfamily